MFFFKNKPLEIAAPISGVLEPIEKTPESSFAKKMIGDGFVIFPKDGNVVAPFAGKVKFIFPSKQAIGLEAKNGLEVLIHIGIDTGLLNGEGFNILVSENQKVKANTPLISFNLEYIKKHAKSIATPIVFTNLDTKKITNLKFGEVEKEEIVAIIE